MTLFDRRREALSLMACGGKQEGLFSYRRWQQTPTPHIGSYLKSNR